MDRALASEAKGPGFESQIAHQFQVVTDFLFLASVRAWTQVSTLKPCIVAMSGATLGVQRDYKINTFFSRPTFSDFINQSSNPWLLS